MSARQEKGTVADDMTLCKCAKIMAEGGNAYEIMVRFFSDRIMDEVGEIDKRKEAKYLRRVERWLASDRYKAIYKECLLRWAMPANMKAQNLLETQLESDQPWLANKAANDIISIYNREMKGGEDGTVTIRIEGMPELGTPDG